VGASQLIALAAVWSMLNQCLPGWTSRETPHYHRITGPDGRIYPSLPLGAHGHRRDAKVEAGHVRSLARFFKIEACAKVTLPHAYG
jgi:hypothetical protein